MRWSEVKAVLDALDGAGVRYWVAGGWGVAALIGRQTREHRDLDLLVDAEELDATLGALGRLAYRPETDALPVRIELAAGDGRWVDLHPVVFDDSGNGVQAGPEGTSYRYRADCFTIGTIRGHDVPCLSAARQREARVGDDPREQDLHDLAQLDRAGL